MRSVLEFIGAYLYIMWRIAEIPILSFLYLILAIVFVGRYITYLCKTVPGIIRRSFQTMHDLSKQVFQYGLKLQSWVLHR